MKYILMDYVKESGWPELTEAEQQQWLGAYIAYMEAMASKKLAAIIREDKTQTKLF